MAEPKASPWVDFAAVKAAADLRKIFDRYELTERLVAGEGQQFRMPCPLPAHAGEKKRPSFSVNLEKKVWRCFGCKASGNAIDFVAAMESIEFRAAAIKVAEWMAMSIDKPKPEPTPTTPEAPAEGELKALGFELKGIDPTHPYLADRGLNEATVEAFGCGFCSRGMMRGRIAVPIHDHAARLIVYGGRHPEGEPPEDVEPWKYPADFPASQIVFNLHRVIAAGDDVGQVVLVDGLFEVMCLHQRGVHAISVFEDDLTNRQLELVALIDKPVAVMRYDSAETIARLAAAGVWVTLAPVPGSFHDLGHLDLPHFPGWRFDLPSDPTHRHPHHRLLTPVSAAGEGLASPVICSFLNQTR